MSRAPPLLGAARIASLATCLVVAVASGTNYVFSAYGPQLGSRLHLSHTQVNVIALSGVVGVYGTAPIWGYVVDTRGPRILLAIAFVGLLVGYSGLWLSYSAGLPEGTSTITTARFAALMMFGALTGIGGNGGIASAMNTTAKSWPDTMRATMCGTVISGFGLSAFLFSTLESALFPGDAAKLLLVLALGTSLPMILGFFFVYAIPLPPHYSLDGGPSEAGYEAIPGDGPPRPFSSGNDSQTNLLARPVHDHLGLGSGDRVDEDRPLMHSEASSEYIVPVASDSVLLSPTTARPLFPPRRRSRSPESLENHRTGRAASVSPAKSSSGSPNIYGRQLFKTVDFWLLFVITVLLGGTGLMYISNVGAISQALFASNNPEYDEVKAAKWQAKQVSTVSILNCLGRIFIGVIADFFKGRLKLPRSFCVVLVSALFVVSQLTAFAVADIHDLWRASALVGLAYGGMFGLFPTVTIEWFGLAHFSGNWGWMSFAPMVGSNIFSIAFGRNLDAHGSDDDSAKRADVPNAHHCIVGRECYVDTLRLTIAACSLALALSVYAAWRDHKRHKRIADVGVGEWQDDER